MDGGQVLCSSSLSSSSQQLHRYSGLVDEDGMSFENIQYSGSCILCISCRQGEVTVDLGDGGGNKPWTVVPGRPMNVYLDELAGSSGNLLVSSVSGKSEVELLYTQGELSDTDLAPDPEWLILNASAEGAVDYDTFGNIVSRIRDVEQYSLAPVDWVDDDTTQYAVFTESDPDFGGKSSIDMSIGPTKMIPVGPTSMFNWLNINQSWSFMGIIKVNDDAVDNTEYSVLWSNGTYSSPGVSGVGLEVGPDFVLRKLFKDTVGLTKHADSDEFFDKPMVVVVTHSVENPGEGTVRSYWQGKWRNSHTFTFYDSYTDILVLGDRGSGKASYKFADLRWKNSVVSQAEIDEYVAMAESEYGIDSSTQQGFPFVGTGDFWRASRGVDGTSWNDTVPGGGEVIDTFGGISDPAPVTQFAGRAGWVSDGVDDYLELPVLPHLAGGASSGMTLAIIYYPGAGQDTTAASLFSMDQYASSGTSGSAALPGTNIWYSNGLNFSNGFAARIDDSSDDECLLIYPSGVENISGDAYLIIIETESATSKYRVTQYDITNDSVIFSEYEDELSPMDMGTGVAAKMFRFHTLTGVEGWLQCGLADVWVQIGPLDSDERSKLIDYARQRYGS